MERHLIALVMALAILAAPALADEDGSSDHDNRLSLMTETPAEGFDLALQLARRAVVATRVCSSSIPESSDRARSSSAIVSSPEPACAFRNTRAWPWAAIRAGQLYALSIH